LPHQILCGFWPLGKFEFESGIEKAARNYAATLENEFGFGAEKECA